MTTESRRELMREVNERKLADEAAAADKQRAEAQAAEAAASAAAAPTPASFRDLLASTPSWDGSKVATREADAVPALPTEHTARPRSVATSLRTLIQCVPHPCALFSVCAADTPSLAQEGQRCRTRRPRGGVHLRRCQRGRAARHGQRAPRAACGNTARGNGSCAAMVTVRLLHKLHKTESIGSRFVHCSRVCEALPVAGALQPCCGACVCDQRRRAASTDCAAAS